MYYALSFAPAPRCVLFGRYRQHQGWEHGGRTLPTDLLIFVIGGEAVFRFHRQSFRAARGDWVLIPKNTAYQARTDNYCDYYFFHFCGLCGSAAALPAGQPDVRPNFSRQPLPLDDPVVYLAERMTSGEAYGELLRLAAEMQRLLFCRRTEERLLFDLFFSQLLLTLAARTRQNGQSGTVSALNRALVYIQAHCTEPLTLAGLSQALGLSKSYLLRIFRRHLGMTVTDYLHGVKLDYAAQLLLGGSMNVSQISEFLGYSDSSYFARLFSRRFGVPPSRFASSLNAAYS